MADTTISIRARPCATARRPRLTSKSLTRPPELERRGRAENLFDNYPGKIPGGTLRPVALSNGQVYPLNGFPGSNGGFWYVRLTQTSRFVDNVSGRLRSGLRAGRRSMGCRPCGPRPWRRALRGPRRPRHRSDRFADVSVLDVARGVLLPHRDVEVGGA